MAKIDLPVVGLIGLLITLILTVTNLQNRFCCGFQGTPLSMLDGSTVVAASTENVLFAMGGATPETTSGVEAALEKAAIYLKNNSSKILLINGKSNADETPNNLGRNRAEAIKQTLLGLGAPDKQILLSDSLTSTVLFLQDKTANALEYQFLTLDYLDLRDGRLSVQADGNLIFPRSSYAFEPIQSEKVSSAFSTLAEHLKNHPGQALNLTGLFAEGEENNSAFPDLGVARANAVKNYLLNQGVPSTQLFVKSRADNSLLFINEELTGGIEYSFEAMPDVSQTLSALEERFKSPLLLYFPNEAQEINLNTDQRRYFADLILYLDQKPDARLMVTGHTDNVGEERYNQRLSRKRAEFVRDYLIQNGLSAARIIAVGKGPAEPISSNGTEEGRAKNRRVEVRLR